MKKIFAANWKLHKTPSEAREFFQKWKMESSSVTSKKDTEVYFFPTSLCLEAASNELKNSGTFWGSQNSYFQAQGAFTGEISASHVKSLGGQAVLVGHSERRSLFHEDNQLLAAKVEFVQNQGLTPFLCIGETLQERDSGKTLEVLFQQLDLGLSKAKSNLPSVVAYEPVWAIGTGRVAEPAQVQEAHSAIHQHLEKKGFHNIALLYGGSVKPENAGELLKIPHVNGFLVGGASLEVGSFLKICSA